MTNQNGNIRAELTRYSLPTESLGIFSFKPSSKIDFQPGQYITLGVNAREKVFRPYSIASSPIKDEIELYIALVAGGNLTSQLFESPNDASYEFRPRAKGKFLLPQKDGKDIIMVSTGTGLAPFMSMLRTAQAEKDERRFLIAHGVSENSRLTYKEEIQSLGANGLHLYLPTVSREECEECITDYVGGLFFRREEEKLGNRISDEEIQQAIDSGRNQGSPIEVILEKTLSPENAHIMVCGNPATVKHLETLAKASGFDNKSFHSERYW